MAVLERLFVKDVDGDNRHGRGETT